MGGVATLSLWAAAVLGIVGLAMRTLALNHAPYSNLFEFSMSFGIAIVLLYGIFELRSGTRLPGAFVLPVACGLYGSALAFPSEGQDILVPALQSPTLLTIHVALMILSYAVLAVAFGGAAMHLVQGFPNAVAERGGRFSWLPSEARCDELTYRAVLVGFPLLGAGIALGAFWANDAWGRYWGWDPKETAALVTWLIFAVYIHGRWLRQFRGARKAWIVVLGFFAVMFTYLGVNLWITGLHSYAGV
ncbi:MAG: c-type cytochrome biogenesis protein CcsB [Chloroflexi bacterium]|nr:c-type cytochrome biogenesis protein CcsB [Chloroflexota bacterium]